MSFIGDILGFNQADAAAQSANIQAQAGQQAIEQQRLAAQQAQGFLTPFSLLGLRGVGLSNFLANPQSQVNFLQQNPLFNLALQNANQQTQQSAAARGRLASGDTLNALANNVLLASQPLIDRQRQDILSLLQLGQGAAQGQANAALGAGSNIANLLTSIGAAQAGGVVGQANAQNQAMQNLLQLGLTAGSFFSDRRLKANIRKVGEQNGFNIYSWVWNRRARKELGLKGVGYGVIAQEVEKVKPEAVKTFGGWKTVDYDEIGVNYGAIG